MKSRTQAKSGLLGTKGLPLHSISNMLPLDSDEELHIRVPMDVSQGMQEVSRPPPVYKDLPGKGPSLPETLKSCCQPGLGLISGLNIKTSAWEHRLFSNSPSVGRKPSL